MLQKLCKAFTHNRPRGRGFGFVGLLTIALRAAARHSLLSYFSRCLATIQRDYRRLSGHHHSNLDTLECLLQGRLSSHWLSGRYDRRKRFQER